MDGRQGKVTPSLQFRLSLWLSLLILGVAFCAGVFSLVSAFDEANDLQDDQLKQVAALIRHYHIPAMRAPTQENVPGTDTESQVVIQVFPARGATGADARGRAGSFPTNLPDGMQTVLADHKSWRVYVSDFGHGERIAVGQQTDLRDEIARDSALRTMMPFALLIPLLLLLVGSLVRQMLKPMKNLALEVNRRSEQDMRPLEDQHLPAEVFPLVQAINRLLARVTQSMALQRRFVADAAHELRSPLTALSLQSERLAAAEMSPSAHERLASLRLGLQRARALLEQLLTLARVQETRVELVVEHTSIRQGFIQVLESLMPLAQAKNIDLGVVGSADYMVDVSDVALAVMIKNLVENAIRYTPAGGRVDLSVEQTTTHVAVRVVDTGPGIPLELRQRVFDPFYRMLGSDESGSGLGLSIVKTIADRLNASIELAPGGSDPSHPGLRATIRFPRGA